MPLTLSGIRLFVHTRIVNNFSTKLVPKSIHGSPIVVLRRHKCWLEKNIELRPKEKERGFDIT
jgi:hypothetical protein